MDQLLSHLSKTFETLLLGYMSGRSHNPLPERIQSYSQ